MYSSFTPMSIQAGHMYSCPSRRLLYDPLYLPVTSKTPSSTQLRACAADANQAKVLTGRAARLYLCALHWALAVCQGKEGAAPVNKPLSTDQLDQHPLVRRAAFFGKSDSLKPLAKHRPKQPQRSQPDRLATRLRTPATSYGAAVTTRAADESTTSSTTHLALLASGSKEVVHNILCGLT